MIRGSCRRSSRQWPRVQYGSALRARLPRQQVEDDSERAAKAQELLGQMFGAATAEAQSGLGPLTQIKNTFGDLQEEIGGIVLEYMQPFIQGLKNLVDAFKNSSQETKEFITQVILVGSVAGPAIVTLGLALKGLALAFAMLTSPITLVVGAIALVAAGFIYATANFDALKERFSSIAWWKNALIDMVQFLVEHSPFGLIIEGINSVLEFAGKNPIPNPFTALSEGLEDLKEVPPEFKNDLLSLSDTAKKVFEELTGLEFDKVFSVNFDLEVDEKEIADSTKGIAPSVPVKVGEDIIIEENFEELEGELEKLEQGFQNVERRAITFKDVLLDFKKPLQDAATSFLDASLTAFTQSLFNAGQFNTKELELRKITLEKQRQALQESLAQQEISQREYALRMALLNEEMLDLETQINEARTARFSRAMDAMKVAAGQAVKAILAEFAKLAIIKGLLAIMGTPTGGFGKFFKSGLEGMLPGKARGGPVFSGQPYMVGERGPELFMPNRSGSIVPNKDLMGGGSMGSTNINLDGEFKIRGTDLVLTLAEANYKLGR